LILFIAQFIPVQTAEANVWKDRDFSLITATSNRGGEVVYVVDNRTGQAAVLVWDAARRTFDVGGVGAVSKAFE
jgi:hypothetical protein